MFSFEFGFVDAFVQESAYNFKKCFISSVDLI